MKKYTIADVLIYKYNWKNEKLGYRWKKKLWTKSSNHLRPFNDWLLFWNMRTKFHIFMYFPTNIDVQPKKTNRTINRSKVRPIFFLKYMVYTFKWAYRVRNLTCRFLINWILKESPFSMIISKNIVKNGI